jgi:hypothetical protein
MQFLKNQKIKGIPAPARPGLKMVSLQNQGRLFVVGHGVSSTCSSDTQKAKVGGECQLYFYQNYTVGNQRMPN